MPKENSFSDPGKRGRLLGPEDALSITKGAVAFIKYKKRIGEQPSRWHGRVNRHTGGVRIDKLEDT